MYVCVLLRRSHIEILLGYFGEQDGGGAVAANSADLLGGRKNLKQLRCVYCL